MNNTIKWVTALLFLYNLILGYVVTNATISAYKLVILAVVGVDCLILFYFIAYVFDLGSMRIMRLSKLAGKGTEKVAGLGLMKSRVNLIIGIILVYNLLLGLLLAEFTANPVIMVLFIGADIFFIFYYVGLIAAERMREHRFKVAHAALIRQAILEIRAQQAAAARRKRSRTSAS